MLCAATEVGDDGFGHKQPLPHEASLQDGEPPMNPSFFVRVIIQ
jgi:hypothetical protein